MAHRQGRHGEEPAVRGWLRYHATLARATATTRCGATQPDAHAAPRLDAANAAPYLRDTAAPSRQRVPAPRNATYADLDALPAGVSAELVSGEIILSPSLGVAHGRATSGMIESLGKFDAGTKRRHGGWWILPVPEIQISDEALIPDLAGWRVQRVPRFPDVAAHTLAPDWLPEILSPSTRKHDREVTLAKYHTWEVPCMWLVDPPERWVQVLSPKPRRWEIIAEAWGDEGVSLHPVEPASLDLSRWWVAGDEG